MDMLLTVILYLFLFWQPEKAWPQEEAIWP
jgi:hypothetical protein